MFFFPSIHKPGMLCASPSPPHCICHTWCSLHQVPGGGVQHCYGLGNVYREPFQPQQHLGKHLSHGVSCLFFLLLSLNSWKVRRVVSLSLLVQLVRSKCLYWVPFWSVVLLTVNPSCTGPLTDTFSSTCKAWDLSDITKDLKTFESIFASSFLLSYTLWISFQLWNRFDLNTHWW